MMPQVPRQTALDARGDLVSPTWDAWFRQLQQAVNRTPAVIGHVAEANQAASIPTTTLVPATSAGPAVHVSYRLQITQAATTSSSAQLTLAWTAAGVAQTQVFAAVTGNTPTTHQSGSYLVRPDRNTAVTWSLAYASVGATPMQYGIEIISESLP